MPRKDDRDGVVYEITGAPRRHSDDLDHRVNRYLVSMAIRTVCFILMVVVQSPLRWAFAVGAVFLPYIAVMMANVGVDKRQRSVPALGEHTVIRAGLPAAPQPPTTADDDPDGRPDS